MSSSRGGPGGIAIVLLLVVVGVAALLAVSAAAPAVSDAAGASLNDQSRPPVLSADQIPERYRLNLGGTVPVYDLGSTRVVTAETMSGPGPGPTDLPFGPNVPIWTDAAAQTRPTMTTDSTGRVYVAFQHEVSVTNRDIYAAWSDNAGATWTTPVAIVATTADEVNPSVIVTTGNRVTVFFQQNAIANAFAYAWSADRGASWTVQPIGFGTAPLSDLQFPSFAPRGAGAYGMYQVWCTLNNPTPPTCMGGAWSAIMLFSNDVSVAGGWSATYFAQPPDVELFHPSTGINAVNGDLVGAMEIEIFDNTAWDFTWFRFNPNPPGFFSQDGLMCGTFCPSNSFVWPSIAVDGTRIVTGAHFFNTTLAPFNVIMAVFSTNGGVVYTLVNGNTGMIDSATVDQKHVSFDIQGPQVVTGYWKAGATWYVTSLNTGGNFGTPARVSDNTPATAIDAPHAVVAVNSTAGPLVAWHDNRDGNANIYFTGFQRFRVTIATTPTGLLARFDGGAWTPAPISQNFTAGSVHTLEVQTPQAGGVGIRYAFTQWNDTSTANPKSLTVRAAVTYTASFVTQYETTIATNPAGRNVIVDAATQVGPYTLWCNATSTHNLDVPTPQSTGPTTRYRFDTWSDGGAKAHPITCSAPATITANLFLQWQVTIATNPAGRTVVVDTVSQVGPYPLWCDDGSPHTVDAPTNQTTAPGTRYRFDTWSDGGARVHSITCVAATTVTANFVLQYQITIDSTPTGRSITVAGVPVTAPYASWWDVGSNVGLLAPSPQTVGAGTRYSFSAWSDGDPNPSRTILADAPKTLTAVFTTEYFLTMSANLGTVSPGNGWHSAGELVPISTTAPPLGVGDRYTFGGWSGDFTGTNPTGGTITMDGPKTVQATWIHEFRIDILSSPPGQTFQVDARTVTTPTVEWWAEGSTHTVTAQATIPIGTDTRWNFASWTGGGTNPVLTVSSVSGSASYTATYTRQFLITLTTDPATGPAVTVDGSAFTGPTVWWDEASQHTLNAGAAPQVAGGTRYVFVSWSDAPTSPASRTYTVTAPGSATATYRTEYLLTIQSSYGSPACQNARETVPTGCWYEAGTEATVTVTTPDGKFVFEGWSGDASGTAPVLKGVMDGPKSVVANWRPMTFIEEFGWLVGVIVGIVVAIVLALLLMMRRRKKPEAVPPGFAAPPAAPAAPPPPPMAAPPFAPSMAPPPMPAPPMAAPQPPAAAGTKTCAACGMEIPAGSTTCPVCGAPV